MHHHTPADLIVAAATPVQNAAAPLTVIHTAQASAEAAIAEAQRRQKAYADKIRSGMIFAKGANVPLKVNGRPQQVRPARKLRPVTISEIKLRVRAQLDMSPAKRHGPDMSHSSQLML